MRNKITLLKKGLCLLLTSALMLTGCAGDSDVSSNDTKSSSAESISAGTTITTTITDSELESATSDTIVKTIDSLEFKTDPAVMNFDSLDDESLSRYMEDYIYDDLVTRINSEDYFVENIETSYLSKEYIEAVEYRSKKNIYFGYTLEELEQQFQGKKFVFTLGEDGTTVVQEFENYDDTFFKVLKDVAIGTGVILFCVTVSVVSAGAGAPAISMIFAASAKTGTTMALSGGIIGAAADGIVTGIQTGNMEEALKAAALGGAKGFKVGAISGALQGGISEAQLVSALKGADVTKNGLTLKQAAKIQKESKYPLDVIKEFRSMDQYNICKNAELTSKMVNGKTALIRNIDLNYVDEATGLTNLERMKQGLAALDPSGKAYELHHIGQHADSTLAILTQDEHRLGDSYKIWHELVGKSEIDRAAFDKTREAFWENIATIMG